MELANHPYEGGHVDGGDRSTDVIAPGPPRNLSLTNSNFSYPQPEEELRRHESNNRRSSLTSNGSMPGMTDSSDSETSFDEDYSTSTNELWDRFWLDSATGPGEQYPVLLRASQTPHCLPKSFPKRRSDEKDDTVAVSKSVSSSQKSTDSSKAVATQALPPRPATRNGSPTYSIYPKPEPNSILRLPLPPRTSSLAPAPLSPPRRQLLKSAKSTINLKPSKSHHNLQPTDTIPPISRMPMAPVSANSVPVSPAYPPPPPPRALRPTSSAFNLRDQSSAYNRMQHNAMAPLSPLSSPAMTPEPAFHTVSRPEAEPFISVFEFDSDHESYMESNSFTKRIARGFHKKSASEKRSSGRRGSDDLEAHGSDKEKRKRGGSLGRILGLRSR
ncbi:uncharacterized protein F4812DRAFT_16678 [Daldinia caldariorum]|uniref:uncharacterized protein n=1 Tax=Daldinia caldariorum TaxID=326644 RepID=UPI00200745D1|nr:uncharacterized protein F4812DRAFT_16678 [Daldinia caldariorum]KAI1472536.1 hypothetical protein F4812DRAFT_16678 [Daldinia caldariorum]